MTGSTCATSMDLNNSSQESSSSFFDFDALGYDEYLDPAPKDDDLDNDETRDDESKNDKPVIHSHASLSRPPEVFPERPKLQTSRPVFEYLPSEIKLLIMRQLPDIASLRSLVFASPHCHQVYRSTRNETFTASTLRTLATRNLLFETPTKHLDILLYGNETPGDLHVNAIHQVYAQMYAKQTVCLEIKQCLALLCIEDCARWCADESSFDENDLIVYHGESYPANVICYHLVLLNEEHSMQY